MYNHIVSKEIMTEENVQKKLKYILTCAKIILDSNNKEENADRLTLLMENVSEILKEKSFRKTKYEEIAETLMYFFIKSRNVKNSNKQFARRTVEILDTIK